MKPVRKESKTNSRGKTTSELEEAIQKNHPDIRGRYLLKVTFRANGSYFLTSFYLMWWKKGWAT